MAGIVKRVGRDRYRLRLGAEEVVLLRSLPDQLRSLLSGQRDSGEGSAPGVGAAGDRPAAAGAGPHGTPEDGVEGTGDAAVLGRLFPHAYLEPEDEGRDAEYRRLVHEDLLAAKLANLDVVTDTLERGTVNMRRWTVELSEDEAAAWLGALNDLRLALGVRLGITEDFGGDIDPSDPQAPALNVLSYLGWLEENLVDALASR